MANYRVKSEMMDKEFETEVEAIEWALHASREEGWQVHVFQWKEATLRYSGCWLLMVVVKWAPGVTLETYFSEDA